MSIQDVIAMIKDEKVSYKLYPNNFPSSAPAVCSIVEVAQGFPKLSNMYDFVISVTTRAGSPGEAERMAVEIQSTLNGKTDLVAGEAQVVSLTAQQSLPFYSGVDSNNLHYYRIDIRALVNLG